MDFARRKHNNVRTCHIAVHNGVEFIQKFMGSVAEAVRENIEVDINLSAKLLSLGVQYFSLLHFNEIDIGTNSRQSKVAHSRFLLLELGEIQLYFEAT